MLVIDMHVGHELAVHADKLLHDGRIPHLPFEPHRLYEMAHGVYMNHFVFYLKHKGKNCVLGHSVLYVYINTKA